MQALRPSQFFVYSLPFLLALAIGPVTAILTISGLLLLAVLLPPSLPELLRNGVVPRLSPKRVPETGKYAFLSLPRLRS